MRPLHTAVGTTLALLLPLGVAQAAWQTLQIAHAVHAVGARALAGIEHLRLRSERQHVAQASLLINDRSCAGFVANRSDQVVTAAHCVPEGARHVSVQTADGRSLMARLDRIDRDTDLALLKLGRPLAVTPLPLATQLPEPKDPLLFVGRFDRGATTQIASVEKLGRCPSLPKVDQAVFTTIDARPGDSGAPVLDTNLRVVALVHGGARCHIAAPVAPLARQLESDAGVAWVLAESTRRR